MRRFILTLVALGLFLGAAVSLSQGQDQNVLDKLMHRKLQQSQKLLEGLALNDFDKMEQAAEDLIEISKQASWQVLKTPQYELHSNDFRRSAEAVAGAARTRNLDGATLGYVDLTMTCVKCHKHVREIRMTRLD